jgi:hypothetical protein
MGFFSKLFGGSKPVEQDVVESVARLEENMHCVASDQHMRAMERGVSSQDETVWRRLKRLERNRQNEEDVSRRRRNDDNSSADFALGLAGVPMPSAGGLTGYAIHNSMHNATSSSSDSSSSRSSSCSYSSSDSGSSYSSSDSGGSSCGGDSGGSSCGGGD